jgi:hypothetical protein
MAHDMHKPTRVAGVGLAGAVMRPFGLFGPFAVRPLLVGASSLAIAGLLGACASHGPSSANPPPAGPSPAAGAQAGSSAQAKNGLDSLPVIGTLKNAESAFADYAHARRRESELRDSVESARDAALIARHRPSVGAPDFLIASGAESRLAAARRELLAGEAATRAARARLYRVLGMNQGAAVQVRAPADAALGAGAQPFAAPDEASRFTPGAAL